MCQSCEVLTINGTPCHEIGCPDAWRDSTRECLECGGNFTPETPNHGFCSKSCTNAYYGVGNDDGDDWDTMEDGEGN